MGFPTGYKGPIFWAISREGSPPAWENPRQSLCLRLRPSLVARPKPTEPPAMETYPAEGTKAVLKCAAQKTILGFARAEPLESAVLQGRAAKKDWQRPLVQRPRVWSSPMSRRGPSVAAIKDPHWYRQVVFEERRPHGPEPRGPLRGGPKGQPVICSEHLVAVRMKDPRGHPMIHGCRRRQRQDQWEAREKKGKSGPPSSRCTKAGQRTWDHSPGPLHGKRDASRKT